MMRRGRKEREINTKRFARDSPLVKVLTKTHSVLWQIDSYQGCQTAGLALIAKTLEANRKVIAFCIINCKILNCHLTQQMSSCTLRGHNYTVITQL